MKLDRLHTFYTHIQELNSEGIKAHLYYFFSGKWFELISASHCDPTYTNTLERVKKNGAVPYHATNNLDAWFYFNSDDCIVQLVFPKSPRKATRARYSERLLKLQENASNAYKVSHNPLTFLLGVCRINKAHRPDSSSLKFEKPYFSPGSVFASS